MVSFLATPVLARLFSPAEYGALIVAAMFIGFLQAPLSLGIEYSLEVYAFDRGDVPDWHRLVTSGLTGLLVWAVAVGAVLLTWRGTLARWIFNADGYETLFVLASAVSVLQILLWYFCKLFLVTFRPWRSVVATGLHGPAAVLMGVVAVGLVSTSVSAYYAVVVAMTAGAAAFGVWSLRSLLVARWSAADVGKMLRYGLPLVPSTLLLAVVPLLDRFFITRLMGLSEAGVFALGLKVASVVALPLPVVSAAYAPHVGRLYFERGDHAAFLGTLFRLAVPVFAGLALAVILFRVPLVALFGGPAYAEAATLVPWVAGAAFFGMVASLTNIGFALRKRTTELLLLAAAAVALGCVLNVVLIPRAGLVGAAWATLAAQLFLQSVGSARSGALLGARPFDLGILWKTTILVAAISAAAGLAPSPRTGWGMAALGAAGLLAYGGGLFALRVVRWRWPLFSRRVA